MFGFLYFRQPAQTPNGEDSGTNFFSQFNPFSKKTITPQDETPTDETPIEDGEVETPTEMKLKRVSSMPVAGYTVFQKERYKEVPIVLPPTEPLPETTPVKTIKPTPPATEFAPALRYVARANGNIYQTFADKIEERKFSTTLVPQVYEAIFGDKGSAVIMRYLKTYGDTIETFAGSLPKELLGGDTTSENEITGSFLSENITDLSISPDSLKIFYLFNVGGGSVGITSGPLGDKKVQVFDSPFTEWLSFWPNSKMITLTTKPSSSVLGHMYTINPEKKDLTNILSGISGLTTLTSPDGKLVLYSNNTLAMNVYDTTTRNSTPLGIRTLPEKCTWSKNSTVAYCFVPSFASGSGHPDTWYQGEISFNDNLWVVDIESGNTTLVLTPSSVQGGEEVDGIKLMLDEIEDYLFFVNKKDSFLWEFELK